MQQTIETKAIAPSVYAVHGNHHDRERYLWELEVTRRSGRATTQLPFAKLPTKTVLDVRGSEENKKDVRLHRLEFFLPANTPVFTAPAPKRKVDSQNRPITCLVYWVEGGMTVKKEVTEIWIHVPGRKPVVMTGSDLPRSLRLVVDVTAPAVDLLDALRGTPLKKKASKQRSSLCFDAQLLSLLLSDSPCSPRCLSTVLREHTVFEPHGSTELQGVQSPEVPFSFQRKKENKVSTPRSNTKAEGAIQPTFASQGVDQQTLPQLQPELQPLSVPQRFSPVVLCLAVGPKKRCTLVTQHSKERDYEWVQFTESTREVTQEKHIPRMGVGLLWSHVLAVVRGDLHSLRNVSPAPASWTSFFEGGPRPFFRTSRKPHARFIQTICFADGPCGLERGEGTCPWSRLNSSGPSVLRATQALNERLVMSNARMTDELPCVPVLQEMFADLIQTTTLGVVKRECMQPNSKVECVFVDPDYQLSRVAAAIVAVVFDDEVEKLCYDFLSSSTVAALRREDGLILNWQGAVPLDSMSDELPCRLIRLDPTGYLVQIEPDQSMAA